MLEDLADEVWIGAGAYHLQHPTVADPDAPAASPHLLIAWLTLDPADSGVTGIGFAAVDASGDGDAPQPLGGCVLGRTINCVQTISATDPLLTAHFDKLHKRFDIASIPGADVAALLVNGSVAAGKARVIRTVLLERHEGGGWTSELLPFVVDEINPVELGSNVAYVARTDGVPGVVPALTSVRRNADSTRTTESTETLLLWERYDGEWKLTEFFSRASPLYERKLLANADGSLAVWASQYGAEPSVFAERALDGTWTWWDAGPRYQDSAGESSFGSGVGRDRQGSLAVATAAYQSTNVMMLRAEDFVKVEPGYCYEQRLQNVFYNALPALPEPALAVDQNYGGGSRPGLVVLADGDPVLAYASGYGAEGAEYVRLTLGDIGACN